MQDVYGNGAFQRDLAMSIKEEGRLIYTGELMKRITGRPSWLEDCGSFVCREQLDFEVLSIKTSSPYFLSI